MIVTDEVAYHVEVGCKLKKPAELCIKNECVSLSSGDSERWDLNTFNGPVFRLLRQR